MRIKEQETRLTLHEHDDDDDDDVSNQISLSGKYTILLNSLSIVLLSPMGNGGINPFILLAMLGM